MRTTRRQVVRSIVRVDWSRFEGLAALRCAVGVAVPLLVGLGIDQPLVGAFGAAGAVGAGFGSFQGAYRSRAGFMSLAAAGMALSVLVGSIAGHSAAATIVVAALWAFVGGLLVALGHGASFVGQQSLVAVLIAGGFPSDLEHAAARAALVLGGGLVQTVLVVMIWPLRRFAVERRNLATVYRSLADYAASIVDREADPPEPHTFANTPSPLSDPQPFARSDQAFAFQALLDEAERIRASLAALALHLLRPGEGDRSGGAEVAGVSATALGEIATALSEGRAPREPADLGHGRRGLSPPPAADPLLSQVRAAWRMARGLSADPEQPARRGGGRAHGRRRPPLLESLTTLRANLTMRSTAFRHALRLATILTLAAAAAQLFELPRGYWMPLTIALVLKPDFHDTFAFSTARVAGTVLGAAGATAIVLGMDPATTGIVALLLGFVWGSYAFAQANYGAFSVCITGYVVLLMALAGVSEVAAATDRIVYTGIAGALALGAYVAWPTWAATEARPAIATMIEEQSGYIGRLLNAYSDPSKPDLRTLAEARASSRLARSNSEAVVERMLTEPRSPLSMAPRTALGIVGATRRNALAALSLHAGLEGETRDPVSGTREFAAHISSRLLALAAAVRQRQAPPPPAAPPELPIVRGTAAGDAPLTEAEVLADSVDTIAGLIAKDAAGSTSL